MEIPNGALIYSKLSDNVYNEATFGRLLLKVKYLWTDMSEEEFIKSVLIPTFYLLDESDFNDVLDAFGYGTYKISYRPIEFTREQLQRMVRHVSMVATSVF